MRNPMKLLTSFILTMSLLLLSFSATHAQGRTIKRLKFSVGTSSAIVKGTITKGEEVAYKLEAKKGQRMRVKLIGKAKNNDVVLAAIDGPNGEQLINDMETSWSGKLPGTGQYSIVIGMIESKSGSYTLEVIITN